MAEENILRNAGKAVKISRINPDNIRSIPINDVVVFHSRNEFFLTFSSVEPPTILEERDFENLREIEAINRAKIVVSPEFAEALMKALEINIENFKQEKTIDVTK